MKYKNAAYRVAEARAIEALHIIARMADWTFRDEPSLVAIRDDPWFYVPTAHLLVVPWVDAFPKGLTTTQRETRCEVLAVGFGGAGRRLPTLYCQYLRCANGRIHDHACLRLWQDEGQELWLLNDPHGESAGVDSFKLDSNGLTACQPPWRSVQELAAGLARANELAP